MGLFVIKKKKGGSQKKPLFIVVKATEIKQASKRNLLRRRIKSVFNNGKRENDYIVIAKKGADMVSFEQIKKEIESQL
jgi:ribonuclease P protein component